MEKQVQVFVFFKAVELMVNVAKAIPGFSVQDVFPSGETADFLLLLSY